MLFFHPRAQWKHPNTAIPPLISVITPAARRRTPDATPGLASEMTAGKMLGTDLPFSPQLSAVWATAAQKFVRRRRLRFWRPFPELYLDHAGCGGRRLALKVPASEFKSVNTCSSVVNALGYPAVALAIAGEGTPILVLWMAVPPIVALELMKHSPQLTSKAQTISQVLKLVASGLVLLGRRTQYCRLIIWRPFRWRDLGDRVAMERRLR